MNPSDIEISKREEFKRIQSEFIQGLALELFDQTQRLHELGDCSRQLLATAAILSPGIVLPPGKKPLKVIRKWIAMQAKDNPAQPIASIDDPDKETLAILIALQIGALKQKNVVKSNLPPLKQREVLTLSAILLIASGLNRSASQSTTIQQIDISLFRILIIADGPQALMDSIAAQRNAKLWEKIGYPKVTILEASRVLSDKHILPTGERPEIDPADTLPEAGRKVMRYQFSQMLSHEAGTRAGEDIEALHDMRVATRRLRAAFEVFGDAFDSKALKPLLRGLRATGRALGQVRDMDVFIEKAQHYLDSLPDQEKAGMNALLQVWHEKRDAARNQMLTYLDSEVYLKFKEKFSEFVLSPGAGILPADQDQIVPRLVRELAPALVYERLATVRAFEPVVGNARVEQLHALRIEFKKFRYTIEYFRDVLGKETNPIIEVVKKIQDHLGDLNDAQVATGLLGNYIDDHTQNININQRTYTPDITATEAYRAFRLAEMEILVTTFPDAWEKFNSQELRKNLALAISVL